jgi:hypothetical protein
MTMYSPRGGDVGDPLREIELEPAEVPAEVPVPEKV